MIDTELKDYFDNYKTLLHIASRLSQNYNKGIANNGRLEIVIAGFNKMLLMYTSLIKLLPHDGGTFDLSSISSISRVLIELSNKLYFFGLDNISEQELEFRIGLYNYLSTIDKQEVAQNLNIKLNKINELELTKNHVLDCKSNLESLSFYTELINNGKIGDLRDIENERKYYTKSKFHESRGINDTISNGFQVIYSKFIHSSPAVIDIHRDYLKNYEEKSKKDKVYAFSILDFVSSYFATTIIELKDFVIDWENILTNDEKELVIKYSKRIK